MSEQQAAPSQRLHLVMGNDDNRSTERPMLRIVRGDATPEEVAAIVAVLSAVGGGEEAPAPRRRSLWSAREYAVGARVAPGPAGWRASVAPR